VERLDGKDLSRQVRKRAGEMRSKHVNAFKRVVLDHLLRGWVGNATNASFATNAFDAMPTLSLHVVCVTNKRVYCISHTINALVAHAHNSKNAIEERRTCYTSAGAPHGGLLLVG
jgi:hypothetical protein